MARRGRPTLRGVLLGVVVNTGASCGGDVTTRQPVLLLGRDGTLTPFGS